MKLAKISDLFSLITTLKKQIVLLVLLTLAYAGIVIINSYLIKVLYDQVYSVFDRKLLYIIMLFSLIAFFVLMLLNGIRQMIITSVRFQLLEKIRLLLLEDIVHYEYKYFVQADSNVFMSRLAEDCDLVAEGLVMIINAIFNILVIITWLVFFFLYVKWVFLVFLVFTIVIIGWVFVWRSRLQKTAYEISQQYSSLYNFIWMIISGIKMIKFEMLHNFMSTILARSEEKLEKSVRQNTLYSNILSALLDPVMWMVIIIIFFFGVRELQAGNMTVGILTFCLIFIWKISEPIIEFNEILTNMQKADGAMKRIAEYTIGKKESGGSSDFKGINSFIEFRNVGLKYSKSNFCLKNISFKIFKGESVAIIGKSGIGKSSIANILVKLFPVTSGEVLFDKAALDDFTLESIRDNIVIVPQTATLYPVSLRTNLNIKERMTDIEITTLLKKLGLRKLVNKLPNGIDTFVKENGIEFSGGEKQRIGLARALALKAGTYIFDEVTANIDPATEKRVLGTIFSLGKAVTKIFITHNLDIISRMDRVLLLSEKGICELGDKEKALETEEMVKLYS